MKNQTRKMWQAPQVKTLGSVDKLTQNSANGHHRKCGGSGDGVITCLQISFS